MGKPLPPAANPAAGTPPTGDRANAVISGALNAAGQVSAPFCIYGAFNVVLYPQMTKSLTTQAGVANATISVGAGLAAGEGIVSTLVPPGAVVASLSTINVGGLTTLQIGGLSTAQIGGLLAGTDAAAVFTGTGVTITATVQLERSFDGGNTWIVCGVGGGGSPASYAFASNAITNPVSIVVSEPEQGVAYRLNMTAWTAGSISYRISTTGLAATAWGVPGV